MEPMNDATPDPNAPTTIAIVTRDDRLFEQAREAGTVLNAACMRAASVQSLEDLCERRSCACVLIDLAAVDATALTLPQRLRQQRCPVQVVYFGRQIDVPTAVAAMRHGAADLLVGSIDAHRLRVVLRRAIRRCRELAASLAARAEAERKVASLTPRETQVMRAVTSGHTNHQIAAQLCISERTVEVHRGRAMHKVGARSVAQMVRIALTASGDVAPEWMGGR